MAASAMIAAGSRTASRDWWTPWVVTALGIAFFVTVCAPVLPYARQHDFLSFYTGAKLARTGDSAGLYDLSKQTAIEKTEVPGLVYIAPYIRPPFYAVLLAPLSLLPLHAAFTIWVVAQVIAVAGIWWWAYRRFGRESLVFCSLFLPAAYGIAHGQDCVWIAILLLISWTVMERGRDGLAGVLAAVALFKFHLMLLIVPVLVVRRRWRMLAAYSIMAGIEAALSLWLIGRAGFRSYLALLTARDLETLSPSPERMLNVRTLLINLRIDSTAVEVLITSAVVLAALWVAHSASEDWVWFWTAILASILIAPHAYEYDAALLLPPMLICIFRETELVLRIVSATAALPVVYLGTLLGPPWSIAPSLALTVWFTLIVGRRCVTIVASQ